jgi:hypothetical protein
MGEVPDRSVGTGYRVATTWAGTLTSSSGRSGHEPVRRQEAFPGGVGHAVGDGETATVCGLPTGGLVVLDLPWDDADLVVPCPVCTLVVADLVPHGPRSN